MERELERGREFEAQPANVYELGYQICEQKRRRADHGKVVSNGVEHQHFNAEPGKPCVWLGIIHGGMWDALGNQMEQKEESPALSKL